MVASIFKPPRKFPVLVVGEGRVEVLDRNVGRRDQHRFGMSPMRIVGIGGGEALGDARSNVGKRMRRRYLAETLV
jgi:hypothetical protein